MNLVLSVCKGISTGIVVGFLIGSFLRARRKEYTPEQKAHAQKLLGKVVTVIRYITFATLCLGLVWCIYFLLLGIFSPAQADYAGNMSELIVGLLTAISIIFAFLEFLRREGGGTQP